VEDVSAREQDFSAKCPEVKPDGGLDIGQGFLVAVAIAHNDTLQSERVGHISIHVPLDNDF